MPGSARHPSIGHRYTSMTFGTQGVRAAGVAILTRSDAPSFPPVPGFSLHDELVQFVTAIGMSIQNIN